MAIFADIIIIKNLEYEKATILDIEPFSEHIYCNGARALDF